MTETSPTPLGNVITIDDERIKSPGTEARTLWPSLTLVRADNNHADRVVISHVSVL
jgi:hypothetical protein